MKLLKTTFFSAIITIVRISSGFVSNKFIAVYTGPTGIAVIGSFSNFITIILTFANGAINTGVVKYSAEYNDDEIKFKSLLSTSFKISMYCSLFIGVILIFFAKFISTNIFSVTDYIYPIKILGFTIILYSLNTLIISILNGKKLIKAYTIVNTTGSLISLLLTIILVFYFKLKGALYALVLSQTIIFFVSLFYILKMNWFSLDLFKEKLNIDLLKKLSHYSLMAIVSALTVPLSQIIIRNILINKFGIQSAGIWQGLIRISDGYLMLLTTAFATYYLPKLSSLQSDQEIKEEIKIGYKFMLPIILTTSLLIYILRFLLIKYLYTNDFYSMSDLFIYQLLGDIFKMSSWILGYLILAKSMTKIYIAIEIVSTIFYVFFSIIFINIFGLMGITIAFALNYFLYFIFMLYLFRGLLFNKKNESTFIG